MKNKATNMKTKFEKYWGEGEKINPLLYVAVVLDPQKKLRFLKFSFSEIYGNTVAKVMVDKVKDLLYELYNFTFLFIHQMCKNKVGVRGQNWKVILMIHL